MSRCTDFNGARPCDRMATRRLLWDELVREGFTITTSRAYCGEHADQEAARLVERKITVTETQA